MRAWTLVLSIVVHAGVISGVVVAPLLATDTLPVPPRITEYVRVTAAMPEPPAAAHTPQPAQPSPDAVPLQPPDAITPEVPRAPTPITDVTDVAVPGGINPTGAIFGQSNPDGGELPPPPPPPPPAPPAPLRVGGVIRAPLKIQDAAPRYPVIAQASRLEGYVILDAVISQEGAVQEVRVLKSQPLFDAAAIEAVRQWRFTPTLLNGQPVPVVMTVTVVFSLR
jgi:protein TonB